MAASRGCEEDDTGEVDSNASIDGENPTPWGSSARFGLASRGMITVRLISQALFRLKTGPQNRERGANIEIEKSDGVLKTAAFFIFIFLFFLLS